MILIGFDVVFLFFLLSFDILEFLLGWKFIRSKDSELDFSCKRAERLQVLSKNEEN